jgi:hypothetical protein
MKRITLLIMMCLLLVVACKKKKEPATVITPPIAPTPSNYFFPFKTGNYWVYQRVNYDGSTNPVVYDTIRVTGDTVIRSITYYNLTQGGDFEGIAGFYGDSAGYVVTPTGPFNVRTQQGDTIAKDSVGGIYYQVTRTGKTDTTISVQAGNFSCVQTIRDFYYPSNYPPPGSNTNPRETYIYYAKNIGLAYTTAFFVSSPYTITMQLVSYHISP